MNVNVLCELLTSANSWKVKQKFIFKFLGPYKLKYFSLLGSLQLKNDFYSLFSADFNLL